MLCIFDFYLGIKLLNFSQVVELHVFPQFSVHTLESDLHRCRVHTAVSEVNESCSVDI